MSKIIVPIWSLFEYNSKKKYYDLKDELRKDKKIEDFFNKDNYDFNLVVQNEPNKKRKEIRLNTSFLIGAKFGKESKLTIDVKKDVNNFFFGFFQPEVDFGGWVVPNGAYELDEETTLTFDKLTIKAENNVETFIDFGKASKKWKEFEINCKQWTVCLNNNNVEKIKISGDNDYYELKDICKLFLHNCNNLKEVDFSEFRGIMQFPVIDSKNICNIKINKDCFIKNTLVNTLNYFNIVDPDIVDYFKKVKPNEIVYIDKKSKEEYVRREDYLLSKANTIFEEKYLKGNVFEIPLDQFIIQYWKYQKAINDKCIDFRIEKLEKFIEEQKKENN